MTLEEQIRDAVARGDFTHLSVVSQGGKFSATFTPAKAFGSHHAVEGDPVKAMQAAMSAAKLARKPRAAVAKPGDTPSSDDPPMDFG